jgi:hypothetical protein
VIFTLFWFSVFSLSEFNLIKFQPHYGPGVDSASNRTEYEEYSWNVLVGKGRLVRKADNLTAIYEPIV